MDDQQFLVHWTYSEQEWHRFIRTDWVEQARELRYVSAIGAMGGLLVGGAASLPRETGDPPWHDRISFTALGVGAAAGFVLGVLAIIFLRLAAARRRKRRMNRVGEFYIGRHGIYELGAFAA